MAGLAEEPSSGLTELPPDLEAQMFAECLDEDRDAAERALADLCARHPHHADELRRVARRLAASSSVVPDLEAIEAAAPLPRIDIPPYRVLREIGRGGFGVVWLAEQTEPLRRLVALKVLLPTAMTDAMLQRFRLERQTLAGMQHPGIASVLDAGTGPAGEPYFAMEYVDGVPITRFADANRLDLDARLILFRRVCAAVQHAHQRGVIHRDLKPGNILVADGSDPQPKVIDFGLAKVSADTLPGAPLTEDGRLLGTLEYMSPEQAAGEPVDTRTDVYALGALLYELLTGEVPFDPRRLRGGGWTAALRIIREHEPRPPSEVLARSDVAEAAARRATTVADLRRRLLRPDLDRDDRAGEGP